MPHAPNDQTHPAPSAFQPQAHARRHRPSRLLPLLGGTLGLVGLIGGVAGCSQAGSSSTSAAPAYSDQQVADAKKAVCDAYEKGVRSLEVAGRRQVDNPADAFPVAVNTRLAEVTVANFLLNELVANPAAPEDLKGAVQNLALAYQNIALTQLADGTKADSEHFGLDADKAIAKIKTQC